MPRLAACDIGSNTVHALVADAFTDAPSPRLEDVAHYVEMPELGAEVARTGRIGRRKGALAIRALQRVLAQARQHGYEELVAGATAAVRNAADRDEFLARASEAIRTPVRLLGEELEARLSFLGVASRHAGRHEWIMADLGGASTEIAAGRGMELVRWASLPIGSGVLAARYLSDPPQPGEREQLRRAAVAALAQAPDAESEKLVVTGGTAATLPLVLSRKSPPMILTVRDLLEAERRLDAAPAAVVAMSAGVPEKRVRAMRAGVEVLLLLLDWSGLDRLHVSHEGLRHGMLLRYLEVGDRWWQM